MFSVGTFLILLTDLYGKWRFKRLMYYALVAAALILTPWVGLRVFQVQASIGDTDQKNTELLPDDHDLPSTIALDGNFDDWIGRANISDLGGDSSNLSGDILSLYWMDSNDEDGMIYWMIQRPEGVSDSVKYSVYMDMNNDGVFAGGADRIVEVTFNPQVHESQVDVEVLRASNNQKIAEYINQDNGESTQEGGSRVEFGVPSEDLAFSFGSAFRMYVESDSGDRAPDTGDVQWASVPIFGYVGLGVALVSATLGVWWFRLRKIGVPETSKA